MLNSDYFLKRYKMLNYHVDKFELTNKRTVFLFKLFPFLSHKFLYIVVLLVCNFDFVVHFDQLLSSMLNFFFQGKMLAFYLILFFHSFP